jgi:hypothetical protein
MSWSKHAQTVLIYSIESPLSSHYGTLCHHEMARPQVADGEDRSNCEYIEYAVTDS